MAVNNALHSTQNNNETFRRYAHYTTLYMAGKLICSPRKIPFVIHRLTTKRFVDMPLIEAAIRMKILIPLEEKCPHLYTE